MWTVTILVTDTLYSVSLTVICATLVLSRLMLQVLYLMPVSSFCWVLSLIYYNCSALFCRKWAPFNRIPHHNIYSELDLKLQFTSPVTRLWNFNTALILNVEMWPYLYLCSVSVCLTVSLQRKLSSDTLKEACPVGCQGQLSPPPKAVPLTINHLSTKQNLTLRSYCFC